jgi:hypothetical protein
MATAKILDMEASPHDRPERPAIPPAGAPNSPVWPDVPDTPGEKRALEAERLLAERGDVTPRDGTSGDIPHGDRGPPRRAR